MDYGNYKKNSEIDNDDEWLESNVKEESFSEHIEYDDVLLTI